MDYVLSHSISIFLVQLNLFNHLKWGTYFKIGYVANWEILIWPGRLLETRHLSGGRRLLDHLRYSVSFLLKLVTLRSSKGEVLI